MEQATLASTNANQKLKVGFKRLNAEVMLPTNDPLELGFNLYLPKDIEVFAGEYGKSVPMQIKCKLPKGYGAIITLSSSMAYYTSLRMSNLTGEIVASCISEIVLVLDNIGNHDVTLIKDECIAQLILIPLPEVEIEEIP